MNYGQYLVKPMIVQLPKKARRLFNIIIIYCRDNVNTNVLFIQKKKTKYTLTTNTLTNSGIF